ncbi:MAG: ABC transporter substrate-binding protein, partial [Candidatus Hodarchaeales archaeon]
SKNGLSPQINQRVDLSTPKTPPKTLRYLDSATWEPNLNFDSIANYSSGINALIFDTLVDYSFSNGALVPSLASQWVVTNDSKQWIFTLREDVIFHDGSKFNASIVKFNYDRFIDPSHPAYVPEPIPELQGIPLESVEILEEFELAFNFYSSYAAFLNTHVTYIDIISPKSFQGPIINSPIGTGPYIINFASSNSTYKNLTRNNNYYRGLPPFETIDYLMFDNDDDLEIAIADHKGDFVPRISANQWDNNDSYWQAGYSDFLSVIDLVWFNHLIPELSDVRVRQALNYAINKDFLIQNSSSGRNLKLLSSIIPQSMDFHDSTIQGYPYNVTKANQLLDEAGYPRNANGYRFNLSITIGRWKEAEGILLVSFLDAVGIMSEVILPDNPKDFGERLLTGNYDMFKAGWIGFMDPAVLTWLFLHTSGTVNSGGYSSSQMDKYILLGQQTPIRQEREYYYKELQQLAQKNVPYLLLSEGYEVYLQASHLVPYISVSKSGRVKLNYTNGNSQNFYYHNVKISELPVYFPFADTVVESTTQLPLNINMTMSHYAKTFFPTEEEIGKFLKVEVDNDEVEYSVRCYYDIDEIPDQSIVEQLALFQWDENETQWSVLKTIASNSSLRYVEVNLKGGYKLLKLSEFVIRVTYQHFPLVFLIIGGTLGFAIIAVVINRFTLLAFKERYKL